MLVSVRCAASKFREVAVLEPRTATSWTGDVILRRRDLRSRAELQPFLARTTDIPDAAGPRFEGKATHKHAVIAIGENVVVHLDARLPSSTATPKVSWEDFRSSDHPWRREHPTDLFYLDIDAEDRPELFLNAAVGEGAMKAVLHDRAKTGIDAALRDLINGWVAQTVWAQLFVAAAASIVADEETGEIGGPGGWRGAVLAGFLPKMFPELPSHEERLRRVVEMRADADQVGGLVARMSTPAFTSLGAIRLLTGSLRAAESGREEVE